MHFYTYIYIQTETRNLIQEAIHNHPYLFPFLHPYRFHTVHCTTHALPIPDATPTIPSCMYRPVVHFTPNLDSILVRARKRR
jgi:hypothetical protein